MRVQKWMAAPVAAVALLGLVGCGDDDGDTTAGDDTTTTAPGEGDGDFEVAAEFVAYCEASAALDEQDGPPTEEQLIELRDEAPSEIEDDVDFVVERFLEEGMNAFADGDVNQAIERVEEWEAENCGRTDDGEEPEPQEPEEGAAVVEITATEYAFEINDTVPAGRTALVMTNDGEEHHHLSIVRFVDGTTREQAEAAVEDGTIQDLVDEDAEDHQSSEAAPGEEAVLNLDLEPGLYGIACFVSAPDGAPHFFKGMFSVLEVS
jgi:uncharacterized cupredoxin-like copper-binding protein